MSWIGLAERGLVPDAWLRRRVRRQLAARLREQEALTPEAHAAWIDTLRTGPIASAAHAQRHPVPPRFFETLLGPRMQHVACLWPHAGATLAEAEEEMLARSCERAGLRDGMRVLDLGCGWGALPLWIAERYPACHVVALTGAKVQSEWIAAACLRRGLANVEPRTEELDHFEPGERFDRVLALGVLEHARNWELLFQRVAGWLAPDGRLFAHFFCHRDFGYACEPRDAGDALARHFLGGGIMPSEQLPYSFPRHLAVERHWRIDGTHARRTLEAWLARLDAGRARVHAALAEHACGVPLAIQRHRWRLFLIACAELFGYARGEAWHLAQFRMGRAR
jgi:cyclopropane-fatty-acyl-phospholipid synthase